MISRGPRRALTSPRVLVVACVGMATIASALVAVDAGSSTSRVASPAAARRDTTTTTTAGGSSQTPTRRSTAPPGRIAFVRPNGDVVVTESNGLNEKVLGSGAAANAAGLTPLAWRQPAADAITFVRKDGALVVAPIDGSAPTVLAKDAVVPADADEGILSWDLTGTLLIYLSGLSNGRVVTRVVDFSKATDTAPPEIRTIGSVRRRPLSQTFSPIDPLVLQRTIDPDTARDFSLSLMEPIDGHQFGTPFSFDDATFSPDGRFVFAVSKRLASVQQMVRVSMTKLGKVEPVIERDRICRPRVSPDATKIVFASGPKCGDVWVVNADATHPKRIVEAASADSTFEAGEFSWSGDGQTITHAACAIVDNAPKCGGKFWNFSVDGKTVKRGVDAGSVLRENRPLLRAVKLSVDVSGALVFSTKMLVGTKSVGQLFSQNAGDVVEVKAVDSNNNARSVELNLVRSTGSSWLSGSMRIIDGDVDETFEFFGQALPTSYGYAKLRGLWFRSQSLPLESGLVVMVLER